MLRRGINMVERGFYLNCMGLAKLVDMLHPNTRIEDLSEDEIDAVFVPQSKLPADYDITEPGAVISGGVKTQNLYDFRDPKLARGKISALYKRHCLEKK